MRFHRNGLFLARAVVAWYNKCIINNDYTASWLCIQVLANTWIMVANLLLSLYNQCDVGVFCAKITDSGRVEVVFGTTVCKKGLRPSRITPISRPRTWIVLRTRNLKKEFPVAPRRWNGSCFARENLRKPKANELVRFAEVPPSFEKSK